MALGILGFVTIFYIIDARRKRNADIWRLIKTFEGVYGPKPMRVKDAIAALEKIRSAKGDNYALAIDEIRVGRKKENANE